MAFTERVANLPLLTGINLPDQVAIVTGAGAGIGRATAYVLAQAGCRLALGEIDADKGEATAQELVAAGHQAVAVPTDVAHRPDVDRLVETALTQFGTIDILVNVAGLYPSKLIMEMTEEEWDHVFGVNIKGVFNCCQAVLSTMVEKKSGKIVNFSSMDGVQPGVMPGRSGYGNSHYCSSKSAVITFTKNLAAEMAPYGINVNTISPGWVGTETARSGGRFEEGLVQVPLGRAAEPEEIGQLVLFLVSEAASFMTGENVIFAGGCIMD